jgi:hypothetical protein
MDANELVSCADRGEASATSDKSARVRPILMWYS